MREMRTALCRDVLSTSRIVTRAVQLPNLVREGQQEQGDSGLLSDRAEAVSKETYGSFSARFLTMPEG